jgi:tRNA (guanine10-N2)-dimethyltransferase
MKFFVLGTQRELSVTEIEAVTGVNNHPLTPPSKVGETLLVETDMPSLVLQDRLGGTVKVGTVVGEFADWDNSAAADLIAAMVTTPDPSLPAGRQGLKSRGTSRVVFGLSVYDAGDAKRAKELRREAEGLGLEVKKRLRAQGRAARLVTSKEKTLSAVVVTTNKLLESGGEFVLIALPDKILVGQTEAVQDFKAWSERDYGRPARDPQSGMLPPKLARIMINLSGAEPDKSTLLDPFCGSGTILMEAALLGFKKIVGNDVSERAVGDTQRNMEWLLSRGQGTPTILGALNLFVSTAQTLSLPEPVDTIVTEPYLGPALHGREHPDFIKKNTAELSRLYRDSFGGLYKLLRPGGKAVVAFPVFKTKSGEIEVATNELLSSLGYQVEKKLRYERPGQLVARQITIMRK